MAMKVEGLFMVYVEYSRRHDWKWSGSGPCGSPKILDAAQPPLECQAFAVGLLALMITQPPFGLGVPPQEAEVKTYVGKLVNGNKVGFVAQHPNGGVLSLPPNVHSGPRVDESLPSGFYKWENHKVVAYGGRFYDPSYGCQYENLADMVCLEIEEYGISGSGAVDYQFWDSKADTDETKSCYLKCKSRQNRTYYFKVWPNSRRVTAGKAEFEGPLASL